MENFNRGHHPKQMEDNIDRCGVSRHVESNQTTTAIYLLSKGTVHEGISFLL